MPYIAGVDGCHGGWFAVFFELNTRNCVWDMYSSIQAILDSAYAPKVVAIDIPIGLLEEAEKGGRPCDRAAREVLGQPRGRSVFSAPIVSALGHPEDYRTALRVNRGSSPSCIGISKQCHSLFPKISEAQSFCSAAFKQRVFEVHPELCFYQINGCQPMCFSKHAKQGAGIEERRKVLESTQLARFVTQILETRQEGVAQDDKLDGLAACWTALRISVGQAIRAVPHVRWPNMWR